MADQATPEGGVPTQPPKKTYTPEEREQVIALAREGRGNKEIGQLMNIHGHTVNGILHVARRSGVLPPLPKNLDKIQMAGAAAAALPTQEASQADIRSRFSAVPYLPPQESSTMPKPPLGRPQQQPAPSPSTAVSDDFTSGRPIVGASGGFTGGNQMVKYTVERLAPPDGLLGTHYGSFTVDELGQTYGEGLYKIARHEPGKAVAMEYTQKVGGSYGPSRLPNNMGPQRPGVSGGARPFSAFGRPPMDRGQGDDAQTPAYRPPMYPRPDSGDRIYDFARHQAPANNSAMDKAIEMLGAMHEKSLAQIDLARKSAPDQHFTKFLETQQEIMNSRFEQERAREIERRETEEAKWERARKEDRERWEREQEAGRLAHERELARLKAEAETRLAEARAVAEERDRRERIDREEREKRAAEERKFLLDLEDRKMALMREEADIKQKRLEAELQRSREEMGSLQQRTADELRETREATTRHIEESNKSLQEQLERDRDNLDREYKLKEKAQDREHELQREMLSLQKENIEKSGGDHIFNTINTVIKEFSKGLEKVVDLKKLEAMTPEAQAVAVAQGQVGVNTPPPPAHEAPAQQPAAPKAQPQAAQPAPKPAMAGEAPKTEAASIVAGVVENKMESMIRENLQKPFFQEVLKEWALHVDACAETGTVDATTFANLYMVMMQDVRNEETRQGCAAFATFMKPRPWKKMFAVLKGALDAETLESFQKAEAGEFYEQFRSMVISQIQDYWEQFLAQKAAAKNGGAPAQQEMPQAPVAQAPVEPQGAPAQSQAEDAPPVPSRESLRAAASPAE